MKTFYKLLLAINCSPFIINCANAQQDFYKASLAAEPMPLAFGSTPLSTLDIDTATSACNGGNTFWGIENSTGMLKEFDLTNNVITYTGNYVPSCAGYSLAASNNLNGGSISPTFYTGQGSTAYYWDGGNTWIAAPGTSPVPLYNASGNGNNLYFHSPGAATDIVKYDGNLFTTIFSTSKLMGCADIAVDNSGNFVFVSGVGAMSDSIFIISPAGQILERYPFVVDVANAYGCFLLNSVFYLALGSGNTVFPNSLIPVTFTGSGVNVGTPVNLPSGTVLTFDLASCNPGTLLGINQQQEISSIIISPNPAVYNITISGIKDHRWEVAIYDVAGNKVMSKQNSVTGNISVNISALTNGIYFIELKTQDNIIRKQFCKM